MTIAIPISLPRRLLALALGLVLVLQSAAGSGVRCGARSLLSGEPCCCSLAGGGERATVDARSSCCAELSSPPRGSGPAVRGATQGCGCGVRPPEPTPALPRTADPRGSDRERADAPERWIADGARASAAAAWLLPPSTLDPPSSASSSSPGRKPPVPSAVARSCERGVNGLLAVYGVALR